MQKKRDIRKKRLRAHAEDRAASRYGLGQHDVDAIEKRIKLFLESRVLSTSEIAVLERLSETRRLIAVKVKDIWLPVVYHAKKRTVMTFLPQSKLEGATLPREATAEEQKEAWLSGEIIPEMIR